MSQSILVVDDDPAQVRVMEMTLREANYEPLTATDGESGLRVFAAHSPDLVILDVMMPGMDGWETCYRIRQISTVPIIFLTGRQTPDDKISGLKLGADDYLVKPFLPAELLARVESVLRRTYHPRRPIQSLLKAGPEVVINRTTREVIVRDETKPLRPGEYMLLLLLAEHAGETLSVDRIARELGMGDEVRRAERVKWHVWKLRQGIESDPKHPKIIVTEAGSGYRLELR